MEPINKQPPKTGQQNSNIRTTDNNEQNRRQDIELPKDRKQINIDVTSDLEREFSGNIELIQKDDIGTSPNFVENITDGAGAGSDNHKLLDNYALPQSDATKLTGNSQESMALTSDDGRESSDNTGIASNGDIVTSSDLVRIITFGADADSDNYKIQNSNATPPSGPENSTEELARNSQESMALISDDGRESSDNTGIASNGDIVTSSDLVRIITFGADADSDNYKAQDSSAMPPSGTENSTGELAGNSQGSTALTSDDGRESSYNTGIASNGDTEASTESLGTIGSEADADSDNYKAQDSSAMPPSGTENSTGELARNSQGSTALTSDDGRESSDNTGIASNGDTEASTESLGTIGSEADEKSDKVRIQKQGDATITIDFATLEKIMVPLDQNSKYTITNIEEILIKHGNEKQNSPLKLIVKSPQKKITISQEETAPLNTKCMREKMMPINSQRTKSAPSKNTVPELRPYSELAKHIFQLLENENYQVRGIFLKWAKIANSIKGIKERVHKTGIEYSLGGVARFYIVIYRDYISIRLNLANKSKINDPKNLCTEPLTSQPYFPKARVWIELRTHNYEKNEQDIKDCLQQVIDAPIESLNQIPAGYKNALLENFKQER